MRDSLRAVWCRAVRQHAGLGQIELWARTLLLRAQGLGTGGQMLVDGAVSVRHILEQVGGLGKVLRDLPTVAVEVGLDTLQLVLQGLGPLSPGKDKIGQANPQRSTDSESP